MPLPGPLFGAQGSQVVRGAMSSTPPDHPPRHSKEHAVIESPFPPPSATEHERLDVHNASIDGSAAALGLCGMTDLHTGRVCRSPGQHHGGCEFTGPA